MTEATITEALAEIKLIGKRIQAKQESVQRYLVRPDVLRDPLEKEGGSAEFVGKELQAIHDLQENIIDIRRAIAAANAANTITLGKETRSIADWLTIRREIAPTTERFLGLIQNTIASSRQEATRRGAAAKDGGEKAFDLVVNISEKELAESVDEFNLQMGGLDGQLSLKNATIRITW